MKARLLEYFRIQRQIFGVCPRSGQLFRLSDCRVYLKERPKRDWMDELDVKGQRLDDQEERLENVAERLRDKARAKGRRLAQLTIRKIDTVFGPRNLDPDEAKVLFHPIDYIVFKGCKVPSGTREIILLDRASRSPEHRRLQASIERAVERGRYDWLTLRVGDDGTIKAD